jgi:hypothetical protein
MKNSTLILTTIMLGIITTLSILFTKVMVILSILAIAILIMFYLISCIADYDDEVFVKKKYNILLIIKRFFEWVDSKPRIIKQSKKKWRAPDNWDSEIK